MPTRSIGALNRKVSNFVKVSDISFGKRLQIGNLRLRHQARKFRIKNLTLFSFATVRLLTALSFSGESSLDCLVMNPINYTRPEWQLHIHPICVPCKKKPSH